MPESLGFSEIASSFVSPEMALARQDIEMEPHIETELRDIKARILTMAGFVEESIDRAIEALQTRNPARLGEVYQLEARINQAHMEIDDVCLRLLARRSPVAADLRLILAIVKINTDLERVGDQSVNLSHNAEHYLKSPAISIAQSLPAMSEKVRRMIRDSLDAFVNSNVELAQEILIRDDLVDADRTRIVNELMQEMRTVPAHIEGSLNLILIARNLERIADHATNIAEDVIFASTGKDVRHGQGKNLSKE